MKRYTVDPSAAQQLAHRLMAQHGLIKRGWSFAFNRRKRYLGLCNYTAKRVELSVYFIDKNDHSAIHDTLLHEIAHAIAGHRSAHGPAWADACRRIGVTPNRTCATAVMPQGPFQAQCPTCHKRHDRHRRPKRRWAYYCRSCGPKDGQLRFTTATPITAPALSSPLIVPITTP